MSDRTSQDGSSSDTTTSTTVTSSDYLGTDVSQEPESTIGTTGSHVTGQRFVRLFRQADASIEGTVDLEAYRLEGLRQEIRQLLEG